MTLYPIFADLSARRVLVVGGGCVAVRKATALLAAGAHLRIGAPHLHARVADWNGRDDVECLCAAFHEDWLDDVWLVVAATDDAALNRRVAEAARARRIFVNVVDDAVLSSFQVPAVIDRSPLIVAISSGGTAPMLARWLRQRLETLIEHAIGPLAALLGRRREAIRKRHPDPAQRRHFYRRLFDGAIRQRLRSGDGDGAERELDRALAEPDSGSRGGVALVGAGPGDPGLLTMHALRRLNEADVILHDRLVDSRVLDLARRDAWRIDVGKRVGGRHDATQQRIHALMLEHVRAGRRVVRLKGGDPFVFGRGGEEIEFLRAHDVAFEVVPGITAAIACAAYAGIPLTHREHANSLAVLTAHCRASTVAQDWAAAAGNAQTLAIYMGASQLDAVRDALLRHGRTADTPIALIENGSLPQQRVLTGTLTQLPALARQYTLRSPALLIVGEVAALASRLHWYGTAPQTLLADAA